MANDKTKVKTEPSVYFYVESAEDIFNVIRNLHFFKRTQ